MRWKTWGHPAVTHHSSVFMKPGNGFSTQVVMIVLPLSLISFVAPAHLSQWGHRQDRVASNNPEGYFLIFCQR